MLATQAMQVTQVRKRDGSIASFNPDKISHAIFKAAQACGGTDFEQAEDITAQVVEQINKKFAGSIPLVEEIQDIVEKVLVHNGHYATSKAYILYRNQRQRARESDALIGATTQLFKDYLDDGDWQIKRTPTAPRTLWVLTITSGRSSPRSFG